MVEPSAISRRSTLAAGAVGGAVFGVCDALHVAHAGRLGLGAPGILTCVVVGALAGAMIGAPVAGVGSWSERARAPEPGAPSAWRAVSLGLGASAVVRVALPWVADASWSAGAPGGVGGAMGAAVLLGWMLLGAAVWALGRLRRGGWLTLALGATGSLGWAFYGRPAVVGGAVPSAERPNVLVVTLGGARADRVPDPAITPHLAKLATEGARFSLAVAPSPDTAVSARALSTGRGPWEGVPEAAGPWSTLAEALAARGWQTAAIVGTDVLSRDGTFDRGFGIYDDEQRWPMGLSETLAGVVVEAFAGPPGHLERPASSVVDRALRAIQGSPGRWFVWVHLDDPAAPFLPPDPWDTRFAPKGDARAAAARLAPEAPLAPSQRAALAGVRDVAQVRARYAGELAYADAEIGRLLAALDTRGAAPHTLVVVAGLAGEPMDEGASWFGRDGDLLEGVVHVPALVRLPGRVPADTVVDAALEIPDLSATILDLTDTMGTLPSITGLSARAALEGKGVARRYARSVGTGDARRVAIRESGALIVHDPTGPERGWLFLNEAGAAVPWTEPRLLDALERAFALDGTGTMPPAALDAEAAALLQQLQVPAAPVAPIAAPPVDPPVAPPAAPEAAPPAAPAAPAAQAEAAPTPPAEAAPPTPTP
jgi:arylsulfatase A-like enzyme